MKNQGGKCVSIQHFSKRGQGEMKLRPFNSLFAFSNTFSVRIFYSHCKMEKYFPVTARWKIKGGKADIA